MPVLGLKDRLRPPVSDLTLGKMILGEAAKGNFRALRVIENASTICDRTFKYHKALLTGTSAASIDLAKGAATLC